MAKGHRGNRARVIPLVRKKNTAASPSFGDVLHRLELKQPVGRVPTEVGELTLRRVF